MCLLTPLVTFRNNKAQRTTITVQREQLRGHIEKASQQNKMKTIVRDPGTINCGVPMMKNPKPTYLYPALLSNQFLLFGVNIHQRQSVSHDNQRINTLNDKKKLKH